MSEITVRKKTLIISNGIKFFVQSRHPAGFLFVGLGDQGHHFFHVLLAAQEDGGPGVEGSRDEVQGRDVTVRRGTAGPLNDEGHGEALVQDPELAARSVLSLGVEEDASVLDGPVDVGDHGPDVASSVGVGARLLPPDVFSHGRLPLVLVAFVDRVDLEHGDQRG